MQGSVVAGRYRLLELIGKGAMGTVWRAEHVPDRAPIAVKIISGDLALHDEARGRFLREAQIAATLESPHLVRVFDFGNVGADPREGLFMVLEHLEGITLKQRIKSQGQLSVSETVLWISHVCHAMAVAHAYGLVHRDIKPANVFLASTHDGAQSARVLDFGVAKAPDVLSMQQMDPTRTGAILGTPYYMSPEQAQGLRDIDHRSDLWAIGVLTFECLTGARPFNGKSLGPLVAQVLHGLIPKVSAHRAVPPALDAWMDRAMQRDRDNRFASAAEMAASLQAAAG